MIKIYYSNHFRKRAKRLNEKQQAKLAQFVVLLKGNPFNLQLHTKALSGKLAGIYSVRITREFRLLFKFFSPDEVVLIDIGNRKDIYR
ncbi:MAG: type II toxin-antitoxin system YoeB family toxin [bacterium]|nr:type II toxin-antitoxin system YoeB family toxin [bacterium]